MQIYTSDGDTISINAELACTSHEILCSLNYVIKWCGKDVFRSPAVTEHTEANNIVTLTLTLTLTLTVTVTERKREREKERKREREKERKREREKENRE